jgi:LuxR family maltose regulon positive regulatory protein
MMRLLATQVETLSYHHDPQSANTSVADCRAESRLTSRLAQRVHPAIGADLLPALVAGQLPPQAALVATLLNDLDAARTLNPSGLRRPEGFGASIICVLDDFHAIQDPAILAVLQSLLAHRASALHLALATRENPALPLARLRASDQLTEVRAADLRFDEAETAAFLRDGMGLAPDGADQPRENDLVIFPQGVI